MFQENGLLLWPADGTDCWIVDPGFPPQTDAIVQAIGEHGLTPRAVLLTHCHVDHIAGVADMRKAFADTPLWCSRDESHMLGRPDANLSSFMGFSIKLAPAERLLSPGETLKLGELSWTVLDVAGHSPGGLAYCCEAAGVVITGDALFSGSIGRTDFPGSSTERLLRNIHENLLTLPDETVVYSGHGPTTTIGVERVDNPFLTSESPL